MHLSSCIQAVSSGGGKAPDNYVCDSSLVIVLMVLCGFRDGTSVLSLDLFNLCRVCISPPSECRKIQNTFLDYIKLYQKRLTF